jgi:hypothetical protein
MEASFSMRPMSYQRKAGIWFFPEILVSKMQSPLKDAGLISGIVT